MKAQTKKSKSTFSSTELAERAIQWRAVEAVIWGMPAVNTDLMFQAMVRETKGGWNQIVYWSRLLDWKNQTLTPNPDGSVDVFFGPKAPAGKESNWVPTKTDREFEVLFRFYGPEKSLFEKKWKLPDIEKVS